VLKEAPPGELFVRTVLLLDDRTKQNDTAKIRVFVDGKEIGAPWRPYKLKSGPHKVSAKKEGAYKLRDGEQAVMIESGQRKNVELVFVRK
ncbi:MAG: hypothetical protein ACE5IR_28025, partial [bacterium]